MFTGFKSPAIADLQAGEDICFAGPSKLQQNGDELSVEVALPDDAHTFVLQELPYTPVE